MARHIPFSPAGRRCRQADEGAGGRMPTRIQVARADHTCNACPNAFIAASANPSDCAGGREACDGEAYPLLPGGEKVPAGG